MLDPSTCSRIRERVEENPENKSCWAMLVQSGKGGGGGGGEGGIGTYHVSR